MTNKGPLDMSEFVDEDSDSEYQLDITKPSEPKPQLEVPLERNKKYASFRDDQLDEEIKKHQFYIQSLQIDPTNLKKTIEALKKEKLVRESEKNKKEQANGNQQGTPAVKVTVDGDNAISRSTRASTSNRKYITETFSKIDGSGSQSKDHEANGFAFSEECVLLNPSKDKMAFMQRSPDSEVLAGHGRRDDLSGSSPRPGLRSSSKPCSECGGSSIDSTCRDCMFYRKQPKRSFEANELPERNASPGPGKKGNGVKKARRSAGDSPEKVVELFSSEDEEEVKVSRVTNDVVEISSQRKVYGTRSRLLPGMEGVRIAYPSRDDPEAVEVSYHDLHRLEPMEFLNDTVIDFYIKYIQRPEVLTLEDKRKFYFFNSFFYKKLTEVVGGQNKKTLADLTKLRKWTKGTNIFEKEYLFVPIHDKWHWSLAIVCHPGATSEDTGSQRCILHLDSLHPGHKSNIVFRLLRTYLIAEWEHQADEDGVKDSFEKLKNDDFLAKKILVPQQENESDCGLFLLHYIELFLKEAPSSFKMCDGEQVWKNWFKPSQASGLRREIQQLLVGFFEKEVSRAKENAKTIEMLSVQRKESENIEQDIQQVNNSDMEIIIPLCSPGKCSAAELVHEHDVSATCSPNFDPLAGSTPPGLPIERTEHLLDSDVETAGACAKANCFDPETSTQFPTASTPPSTDFCTM